MLPEITKLQFKTGVEKDLSKIGKSFLFDFTRGDFILQDGRPVEVSEIYALMVWVEKILRTEKYRYKVYEREDENEYGVVLEDLIIGNNLPYSFVEAELKREITQALTKHTMIQALSDWKIEKNNPELSISFKINLSDGNSIDYEFNPLTLKSMYINNTWDTITSFTWYKIETSTWEELKII